MKLENGWLFVEPYEVEEKEEATKTNCQFYIPVEDKKEYKEVGWYTVLNSDNEAFSKNTKILVKHVDVMNTSLPGMGNKKIFYFVSSRAIIASFEDDEFDAKAIRL